MDGKLLGLASDSWSAVSSRPLGIKVVYVAVVVCSLLLSAHLLLHVPKRTAPKWLSAPDHEGHAGKSLKNSTASERAPEVPLDPFARPAGVQSCEARDLASIAGAPPCQDLAPSPGHERDTAKVALLFLAKGPIQTEPIWTAFIASAAELELRKAVPPARPAQPDMFPEVPRSQEEVDAKCWAHGGMAVPLVVPPRPQYAGPRPPKIANVTGWLRDSCVAPMTPRELYEKQTLFTIYVHRSPGTETAPEESIFYDRDIPDPIQGVFAQPSLVEAHRRLLRAALADEANTMFALMSESCMPLYHPALFWAQLISEAHMTRMSDGMFGVHRWSAKMATDRLKPGHFRKGSQWASLTRMHAKLAAYDEHVWRQFEQFCRTAMMCNRNNPNAGHICVADEHYVATLLSAYQMRDTFDRIGRLAFTDWKTEGGWHPRTFYPGDTLQSIYTMRTRSGPAGCDVVPLRAMQSAAKLFRNDGTCQASGDHIVPLADRDFYAPPEPPLLQGQNTQGRRSLLTEGGEEWPLGPLVEDGAAGAGGAARRLLLQVPEFGDARDRTLFSRAATIRQAQIANLRNTSWLGGFEPMLLTCPLTARKLSPEAVSEFASIAWRCDGLGFSWDCLHGSAQQGAQSRGAGVVGA